MNDIYNVSELLFTVLYAYDTCVVIHGKDMLSIITTLNHELHMLYTLLKANKLFSKVFERVMYNHITDFSDSLNVLYKYQFGFRHKTLLNRLSSLWLTKLRHL